MRRHSLPGRFPSCHRCWENLASQQIPNRQISIGLVRDIDSRYAFHVEDAHLCFCPSFDFCFSRSSPGGGLRVGRASKTAMFSFFPRGNLSKYHLDFFDFEFLFCLVLFGTFTKYHRDFFVFEFLFFAVWWSSETSALVSRGGPGKTNLHSRPERFNFNRI